jgi:hypothetical protein
MGTRCNTPTAAFYLMAVVCACSLSGCTAMGNMMVAIGNCFESHHDLKEQLHDERQDLRQELARVRQQERLKVQESVLAEERANLAQLKQCLPETAPFTETTIALPLQQKYVFGPPELEVREMEELIKAQKEGLEERMAQWRRDMKAYNERKALHEKNEVARLENLRNFPPTAPYTQPKNCGCQQALTTGRCCCPVEQQGHCGCEQALRCGHCCCKRQCAEEKTCEYAPQKKQPFTEKPPVMPRENILASELPIKIPVKVLQEVGESKVSNVRTGRAPLQEKPLLPLKGQCNPGECTDGVPCDRSLGGGGHVPTPPAPVVSDEPESTGETARRPISPKPPAPPTPPPEARSPKTKKFNIFGQQPQQPDRPKMGLAATRLPSVETE